MAYLDDDFIQMARKLFKDRILEDTCKFRVVGEMSIGSDGIPVDNPVSYRTYEGIQEIPCVIYQSRAFENQTLEYQTAIANRFYLEVPADFVFDGTDVVEKDDRVFEIRKLGGLGRADLTIEIVIAELQADIDG